MKIEKDRLKEVFPFDAHKFIFSNPVKKSGEYKKIVVSVLDGELRAEKFTSTQVFHSKIENIFGFANEQLSMSFKQLNAWDEAFEYNIRAVKGAFLFSRRTAAETAPEKKNLHNREKNYLLKSEKIIPPLVDMGIMTPEGQIIKSMNDKYRQINRFIEMIDDELKTLQPGKEINIIDFGCGKSYLTFILYYYLTEIRGLKPCMTGLDLKEPVIKKCNETAEKYGYDGLRFVLGDIKGYSSEKPVDMVITLHACDTATDYALFNAVKWNTGLIFSVPCCQHELNSQLSGEKHKILSRYGIVQDRFCSLATDSIRANLLIACGYKTQILEFIDLSHTPKNLLIRAKKVSLPAQVRAQALNEAAEIIKDFSFEPTLYRLLKNENFFM